MFSNKSHTINTPSFRHKSTQRSPLTRRTRHYITPSSFIDRDVPASPTFSGSTRHKKLTASTEEILKHHHRYNIGKSPLAPTVPEITLESSFFHRGVAALYDTADIPTKLNIITESRRLLRKKQINLINWQSDKDLYLYLHFGTNDISQMPTPEDFFSIKPWSGPHQNLAALNEHIWGNIVKNPDNAWVMPARPEKPHLYHRVFGAKDIGVPLNAHIVHTLAHIELNAVEMYLDTILRFGITPPNGHILTSMRQQHVATNIDANHNKIVLNDLANLYNSNETYINPFSHSYFPGTLIPRVPQAPLFPTHSSDDRFPILDDGYNIKHPGFIEDMLTIVSDETRHFRLCCDRLVELSQETGEDHTYGSQPSTYQLWVLGVNTRNDVAERLAVIPLSQEARGLDSTTRFINRLYSMADKKTAGLVFLIGKEEERHVSLGVKWFLYTAAARGIVSPAYCAEYDYTKIPYLDLVPEEKHDFVVAPRNKNRPTGLKTHKKEHEYDASGYWTDSEHFLDQMEQDKQIKDLEMIIETPEFKKQYQNEQNLPQISAYAPQVPIHVKQISKEQRTTEEERAICDQNIAKYWQNNVTDHFDIGFLPPFNRLARYSSGMPESWYLPLAAPTHPVQFVSVAPNAPAGAPIRKHFKRIIDKMNWDHRDKH